MIGRLQGKVVHEEPTGSFILDVGGVGYELQCPLGTAARARQTDAPDSVVVYVHTNLRQDALELFGFASLHDRAAFRQLTHVPNVGPKLALSVLNVFSVAELTSVIEREDKVKLSKVPGVGKKTAERLVLELKDKLPKLHLDPSPVSSAARAPGQQAERLIAALTGLGYRPAEAERACKTLMDGPDAQADLAGLLRKALKILSS